MKKLTELDLQLALDECDAKKFRSHGAWLAGMVKRLNEALEGTPPKSFKRFFRKPEEKIIVKTGNSTEPGVPCIS